MRTHSRLISPLLMAALLPLLTMPQLAGAQSFRNTVCSFWIKGNPLGTQPCRTIRSNGRVMTINYLAGETPGQGNPETVSSGQDGWGPGNNPECLVYRPTGYAICEK